MSEALIEKLSALPASAKQAKAEGKAFYFNPRKPRCRYGHVSARYASKWQCRQCVTGSPLPDTDRRKPTEAQRLARAAERAAKAEQRKAEKSVAAARAARTRADEARAESEHRNRQRAVTRNPAKAGQVTPEGDHSKLRTVTEEWTEEVPMVLYESGGRLGYHLAMVKAAEDELGVSRSDILSVRDAETGEVLWQPPRTVVVSVNRPRTEPTQSTFRPPKVSMSETMRRAMETRSEPG